MLFFSDTARFQVISIAEQKIQPPIAVMSRDISQSSTASGFVRGMTLDRIADGVERYLISLPDQFNRSVMTC
jgi:hypothetical protein